jgi:hypothetical protein
VRVLGALDVQPDARGTFVYVGRDEDKELRIQAWSQAVGGDESCDLWVIRRI